MSEILTHIPYGTYDAENLIQAYWDSRTISIALDTAHPHGNTFQVEHFGDERRRIFLEQIVQWNKDELFGKNIGLLQFENQVKTYDPSLEGEQVLKGFFFLKKEQLQNLNLAHSVNFIADVAAASIVRVGNGDYMYRPDSESLRYQEAIDNMLTTVVEKPFAHALRSATFIQQWEYDKQGVRQLKTKWGYMHEALITALVTTQKLDFEYDRYVVNESNYRAWRDGREAGDVRNYVDLSPTPEITELAKQRGYEGNDTIMIGSWNPISEQEVVDQHWLKAPRWKFVKLLQAIGKDINDDATDVDIMKYSGFYNDSEVAIIKAFIDENNGCISEKKIELEAYQHGEFRSYLEPRLQPLLFKAGEKLVRGEDVRQDMEDIVSFLKYSQSKLKGEMRDRWGLDIIGYGLTQEERTAYDYDDRSRYDFVERKNMTLDWCGGSIGSDGAPQPLDFYKNSSDLMAALIRGEDEYGPLNITCGNKNCAGFVRLPGQLYSECLSCGKAIVRC